ASGQPPDSQTVRVPGPMLLPTLVPLAVALGETPRVGRSYTFPIFNPATTTPGPVRFTIRAESLFTLVDSAALDSVKGEWVRAHTDTVRAWRVEPSVASGIGDFSGWVDAAGRIVEREGPRAMTIRRMAYEIAFENWRIARDRARTANAAGGERNIFERTVISAGALPLGSRLATLTVRLGPADLGGYDLTGGRQTLAGDTLRIRQESDIDIVANWSLLRNLHASGARFRADLKEEPLLQVHDPRIVKLAVRIAGLERDPGLIAEKINHWVHDSIGNGATFSVPNALEVLRTRKGDCNDHTQLAIALARALGIPARAATGLAFVNGRFYFHAWPEVYLRDWVAMDPTFGQFPADASHLRFVAGSLARQTDFLRLMGTLHITVVEAR
ncbi:MAG TPA: transglutaminase-like domain-containing protein, partial [Gemmatimonadaceae bacterium]|nr:transglutaminase-like domain-containing protein [Gemmatimonadaceae bacterium]